MKRKLNWRLEQIKSLEMSRHTTRSAQRKPFGFVCETEISDVSELLSSVCWNAQNCTLKGCLISTKIGCIEINLVKNEFLLLEICVCEILFYFVGLIALLLWGKVLFYNVKIKIV